MKNHGLSRRAAYGLGHQVALGVGDKNRDKSLKGNLALRAQDLIRKISEQHHVRIIGGHVGRDHVRLSVSALMQFDSSRWRTSALAGFSRNKRLSVALETYRLSAGSGLV